MIGNDKKLKIILKINGVLDISKFLHLVKLSDQFDHWKQNEWSWNMRMFVIGFINQAGIGTCLLYLGNLSYAQDRNLEFALF